VHRLTKEQARRIAVHAQLLHAPRPTELLTVVQHLTLLQIDLTAAIAPSADLVLWSRLGSTRSPAASCPRADDSVGPSDDFAGPAESVGIAVPSLGRAAAQAKDHSTELGERG
jgi:hypothetical protein